MVTLFVLAVVLLVVEVLVFAVQRQNWYGPYRPPVKTRWIVYGTGMLLARGLLYAPILVLGRITAGRAGLILLLLVLAGVTPFREAWYALPGGRDNRKMELLWTAATVVLVLLSLYVLSILCFNDTSAA